MREKEATEERTTTVVVNPCFAGPSSIGFDAGNGDHGDNGGTQDKTSGKTRAAPVLASLLSSKPFTGQPSHPWPYWKKPRGANPESKWKTQNLKHLFVRLVFIALGIYAIVTHITQQFELRKNPPTNMHYEAKGGAINFPRVLICPSQSPDIPSTVQWDFETEDYAGV